MAIPKKVINFLEKEKIKYEIIPHKTVYTAFDKARTLKIKPKTTGKTLVLKADKDNILILAPGDKRVHKQKLKKTINDWKKKDNQKPVKKIEFLTERVIKNKFKGIKLGAIPPFSGLWKMPLLIDSSLLKEKHILVSSGSYDSSFKLSPKVLDGIKGSFSKKKQGT